MSSQNKESTYIVNDEVYELLQELDAIRSDIKNLEERKSYIYKIIGNAVGDNGVMEDTEGNVLATYKKIERDVFDGARFKEAFPDIYERFLKKSELRTFVLKFNHYKDLGR